MDIGQINDFLKNNSVIIFATTVAGLLGTLMAFISNLGKINEYLKKHKKIKILIIATVPCALSGLLIFCFLHKQVETYKITYELNGGSGTESRDSIYTGKSDTLFLPAASLKKDGYIFAGWYDNQGCKGEPVSYIPPQSMGDKCFWAKWEKTPKDIINDPEVKKIKNEVIELVKKARGFVVNSTDNALECFRNAYHEYQKLKRPEKISGDINEKDFTTQIRMYNQFFERLEERNILKQKGIDN